jgi:hypothetical protein
MRAPAAWYRRHVRLHVQVLLPSVTVAASLALAACTQLTPAQSAATAIVGVATAVPTIQAAGTAAAATAPVVRTAVSATAQSAGTQAAGTVQAAATIVAPTVGAAQTQTAPTISAVQTQIAPTVSAVQTQVGGAVQPVVATSVAGSPVQISQVQVSEADTTISIRNSGTREASIGAWILFMGTFPFVLPTNSNMRIDPGQTLTLHFSRGTDTATDVYVGQAPQPLVNNLQNGATLVLVDLTGQIASVYRIP